MLKVILFIDTRSRLRYKDSSIVAELYTRR